MEYCLVQQGVVLSDIDFVAFYDKPFLKFGASVRNLVAFASRGLRSFAMAMPLWCGEKLFQKNLLRNELKKFSEDLDWEHRLPFAEHIRARQRAHFILRPLKERSFSLWMAWAKGPSS